MPMNPIPLPAPYGGINAKLPIIAIESPQCQTLLNFNVTNAGIELRKGDSVYKSFTLPLSSSTHNGLAAYGDSNLFLPVYNASTSKIDFYDVEAGTVTYSSGASGTSVFYEQYFNNYLFFFTPGTYAPGFYFDGSSFGTIGYTGSGFLPTGGGCAYNKRNYIIQYSSSSYWYSQDKYVTDSCFQVDLSSELDEKANLLNIVPITLSDTTTTQILIAFIFANGEILFYNGSYPDGDDWNILGRAKVGQLVSLANSVVRYQGDAFVLCDTGIVSLRDLFLKGSLDALNLSVSAQINPIWRTLIKNARAFVSLPSGFLNAAIRGVWEDSTNRVIIAVPFTSDGTASGLTFFVLNTELGSWMIHSRTAPNTFYDIIKYKNTIYYSCQATSNTVNQIALIYQKEGASGFTDRNALNTAETAYPFDVISAPISQSTAFIKKCSGMDLIMNSDMYDVANFYLIKDLGVVTSSAQLLSGVPTGSLQKPFINMGIEGTYIQFRIAGTTTSGKTAGLKIYGENIYVDQGGSTR